MITGTGGSDSIIGGSGSDLFHGTLGSDTYVGVGGVDTLSYAGLSSSVVLHLDTSSASHTAGGTDSFSGITHFVGTNHGDTIYGSNGDDNVLGGSGSNHFYASTGNDVLDGGVGGVNTIDFSNATTGVNVNLTAGTASGWGNDTLSHFQNVIGSNNNDTITGSTGSDSIIGGTGHEYFVATIGSDTYVGGSGADTLDYSGLGGSLNASLTGSDATIAKTAGGTDIVHTTADIIGTSGSNSFTLDTSALETFNSVDGGSGGTSSATVTDTATADTSVNTQMGHLFSNIGTLDLHSLTLAGDSWGSNITGSEILHMLGGNYGTTLQLTVANGSNLATTLGAAIADDGIFTSHSTVGNTTTWTDTLGHNISLHVTAV